MAQESSAPTRRDLLKVVAAGSAFVALSPDRASAGSPPRPHNIIFMVADGMSTGLPSLADSFSRLIRGQGTRWAALAKDPRTAVGWSETTSLGSMVTDSSAASSAWATGTHVMNGAVNVLPDGRRLTPIGTLVRQSGLRVGLVTTTTITHATPAGFAAVHPDRDDEATIATQYLKTVDVLLGGGRQFFDPALRKDKRPLIEEFRAAGYHACDTRAGLSAAPASGLLVGLFANGHIPYAIDRQHDATIERDVPTLSEMTAKALAILSRAPRGFLLQVEGGRVDHAAHENDAAGALRELVEFDAALGVALDFAARKGDTLVVVTSDHGNSNPGLNGIGTEYAGSTAGFESLAKFRASFATIQQRLRAEGTGEGRTGAALVSDVVREFCGISLSADEAATIAGAVRGPRPEINKLQANLAGITAQVLGNHTGIGWTGTSHTADFTTVLATGPGRERFAGLRPNTDMFGALTGLLGIDFMNPRMSADEARRHTAAHYQQPTSVHWV